MINNILKVGAIIMTGRFLKPRFRGLLALILFWVIVRFLHSEYLSYVQLSNDSQFLWQASLIKIALYVLGIIIYGLIVERSILLNEKNKIELSQRNNSDEKAEDDGFNFLRGKKKLSSQSEQLLKKES